MRAIHLSVYGNPVEGLGFANVPEPKAPGANEVLVAIEYSPINPNDLLVAQGVYPLRPELPSVIGNEGVGRVLAVGPGVANIAVDDRVVPPRSSWVWRERMVIPPKGSLRCLGERTRNSSRCWRSIRRPRRSCSATTSI
jgi:NADPH:quinone reductase-like Zn-dependent oxidoreductase